MSEQDIIYWLDTQITSAKKEERSSDESEDHSMAMYWFGRWKALWDVKEHIEKQTR